MEIVRLLVQSKIITYEVRIELIHRNSPKKRQFPILDKKKEKSGPRPTFLEHGRQFPLPGKSRKCHRAEHVSVRERKRASLSLSLSSVPGGGAPNPTFSTPRPRFFDFFLLFLPSPLSPSFRRTWRVTGWTGGGINYAKRDSYDRYTRYIHPRRINLQPSFPIMAGPPLLSIAFPRITSSIWESTFANSGVFGEI